VCSVVQDKEMGKMYGTQFMAKSLTFVCEPGLVFLRLGPGRMKPFKV
jgi:hypothetical protein